MKTLPWATTPWRLLGMIFFLLVLICSMCAIICQRGAQVSPMSVSMFSQRWALRDLQVFEATLLRTSDLQAHSGVPECDKRCSWGSPEWSSSFPIDARRPRPVDEPMVET